MPKKTFESDLTRLQEIVAMVESSETTLENAIKLYKEGMALATKCGTALTKYDQEVELLQRENETDEWQKVLQHF